jgi:predicted AAA+ superfamily ATPase
MPNFMEQPLIQKLIRDFQARPLPVHTRRDGDLPFLRDTCLCLTGARRSGKTYRTYQYIAELAARGVPSENICRLQFNDHRLAGYRAKDLSQVDEGYYALFPEKRGREEVYFIFDEIQRINGWEDYILSLLEEPRQRVLITGSTAKLLKGDIASGLRGKNFPVILYPFSFREFLRHYQVPEDAVSSRGQAFLRKMMVRYLAQGGFPGLLEAAAGLHTEILQNYWDTMVLRDIIEAHPDDSINLPAFSYFAQALLNRVGCPTTVRGILGGMRQAGLKFSPETMYKYLRYLEEAFMIYPVSLYSRSEKVRGRHYQKVYAVDWALADAVAPGEGIEVSRKLENVVFLELKRRGCRVHYYRTAAGQEIDFIATGPDRRKRPEAFQVCYDFKNPEVRERELRGFPETAERLKTSASYVITYNDEETIHYGGLTIPVVPIWKWLLNLTDRFTMFRK